MGPKIVRNSKIYDQIQEGEKFLLEQLIKCEKLVGWTVYEQPHLNGDRPDFVICHPEKGVVIIEVKDWNLNSSNYRSVGKVLGADGKWKNVNPTEQVKKYKDNLTKYISKQYLTMEEDFNNAAYGVVETVIYFHNSTLEEAKEFCGNEAFKSYTRIICKEQVEAIGKSEFSFGGIQTFKLRKSKFAEGGLLQHFVNDLEAWMNPSDYHMERLEPIQLFPDQKEAVKIKPNSYRRLSGVAGSGKSLILATKAADLLKKSDRVLVLTYNITLRHYLRDLTSQQFGTGDRTLIRDNLVILHFHQFIQKVAAAHNIELPNSSEENFELDWIKKVEQEISQCGIEQDFNFDAILIDEGQDLKKEWLMFLKQFFTGKSEFFVFYDVDQDLYGRQKDVWIEDSNEIQGLGFRGPAGRLKTTRRLPGMAVQAVSLLRDYFNDQNKQEIYIPERQLEFFTKIAWKNFSGNSYIETVYTDLNTLLQNGASIDDIAILTTSEKAGVPIVKDLKSNGYAVSHVYDLNGEGDINRRRNEKWRFQPGDGRLRVCSVHSFKGWEASHIIFILEEMYSKSISIIDSNDKHPIFFKPAWEMPIETENKSHVIGLPNKKGEEKAENLLFIALTRVRYHQSMESCSFTCLNYIPKYNDLAQIFSSNFGDFS